jgi:serine/threonine protein kinase
MGKPYDGTLTDSWAVGVVLYALVTGGLPFVEEEEVSRERGEGLERRVSTRGGRKGYLLKIAKAEYSWPLPGATTGKIEVTQGLKELVSRLLVRDPNKRWRIDGKELWNSEWMQRGEGRVTRVEGIVRSSEADLAMRRGSDQVDFNDSRD